MNETTGKAASSLAITEKKAQKPGGCVGIFFQLFDWNRRFAKKMLFSKKMLPPARAKQTSKKFGGNEKMPKTKLHLIADENSGGFPNSMKNGIRGNGDVEHKQEMQAPGLVARLMGLESLPTVHRDKHRKANNSDPCNAREERFVNSHSGSSREDLPTEKGNAQVESRPQKLQKTGKFERRTVTRFGTEALQIKGVLSRSKKSHHPKLASPVKSPRISASRNASRTSRLIDAATRILEPGLQATNRAKCALTYSTSVKYAPNDDTLTGGGMPIISADVDKKPQNSGSYDAAVNKSFVGQTSCRNCGNLLDVVDSEATVEKPTYVGPLSPSVMFTSSSQGSEKVKPRPVSSSPDPVMDALSQKNSMQHSVAVGKFQDNRQPASAAGKQDNIQGYSEPTAEESIFFQERHAQKQLRSQQFRSQKNEPSSIAFKDKILAQNEMQVGRDRTAQRARLSNLQNSRAAVVSGAIASKRNLSGRPRASTKTDNLMIDDERKLCSRQNDSLPQIRSPMRKRRTVNANAQAEGIGLGNIRQRSIKRDVVNGKEPELNGRPMYHTRAKSRSACHIGSNRASSDKNNEAISFAFNSPSRQKTSVSMGLKERIDQIDKTITCHRKLVLDENESKAKSYYKNCLPLTGDALGMLLEQKLRELTSQEEEESTSRGAPQERSAAMILQELISALTSAHSEQPSSPLGHTSNVNASFQGLRATSLACSHDGTRLSPGSVLEASFSNDSCISSSVDDSPAGLLVPDSADYSYVQQKPLETDFEFLDSATSIDEGNTGSIIVIELLNHISRTLQSINFAGGRLTGSKLYHAKEVILNAELLFGTASSWNSDRVKRLCISPSLLDKLETLGAALWMNLNSLLFLDENKGNDRLRRFLFDCVVEFLDSKYGRYSNCGFKAWRRVPKSINPEMLIGEMEKEVRRWTNLVGMIPDEIIQWEMSHSLGKWTDFEVEAFETGAQIDWEILQTLMDEIVTDFWN